MLTKTPHAQAPLQLNSLTGTYATSTYLAALKKSSKDLEALAKDIQAFDKKIKDDSKVAAFIRALPSVFPLSSTRTYILHSSA
jgi:F-type H+-transporting ATPase subunit O